jgi:hypothetical protein
MKLILTTLLLTVFLAGCTMNKTAQPADNVDNTVQVEDQGAVEGSSDWVGVSSALESGQAVKCQMVNNETQQTAVYLVQGEKMKIVGIPTGENQEMGSLYSDGEYMYTWGLESRMGAKMKIEKPEMTDTELSETQAAQDMSLQDLQTYQDQGYQVDCAGTVLDDSEFMVPEDVQFTDLSAAMGQ